MRILILADNIDQLNPATDTGLSLACEGISRGHEVFWTTASDLQFRFDSSHAAPESRVLKIKGLQAGAFPEFESKFGKVESLNTFDTIWIRKDPPFDTEFIYATYMLERAELAGTLIVNKPQSLRDYCLDTQTSADDIHFVLSQRLLHMIKNNHMVVQSKPQIGQLTIVLGRVGQIFDIADRVVTRVADRPTNERR